VEKDETNKEEGYRLVDVADKGGSEVKVVGYQINESVAAAFTFAMPGEGLAEKIGITNDVGMIAIHFYAQKMEGDAVLAKPLGRDPKFVRGGPGPDVTIKDGRPLPNSVIGIRPKLYENPVEVWRIFYRGAGQLPEDFKKEDRMPITGGPFKMTAKPEI
jgi:hypothetical protein